MILLRLRKRRPRPFELRAAQLHRHLIGRRLYLKEQVAGAYEGALFEADLRDLSGYLRLYLNILDRLHTSHVLGRLGGDIRRPDGCDRYKRLPRRSLPPGGRFFRRYFAATGRRRDHRRDERDLDPGGSRPAGQFKILFVTRVLHFSTFSSIYIL
ncbi:hypothetical protein SDC9_100699 [bioreactor metagenome]|uniref:Uncharacterized protein n=1 Tax=bioreactor metagenome TaxID=1076179 RepID=A0A645ALA8_9ZZZZ